jgi:tetratricopeptide (TPR) repeat protein
MRSTHLIVVAAMMLHASMPSAALAQPVAQDQQQARLLFDQAESHKRKGDEHAARGEQDAAREAYGQAADAYTRAFELYEHSAFIYNLAQMRRLRGERLRAIRAYETFLVLDPNGPQAATAKTFIAQLTVELDAEASKTEPDPRPPEPEPDTPPEPAPPTGPTTEPVGPTTGPNSTVPGGTSSPQPDHPLAISDTRPDPARGRGLRVAGMVSMAAGAVGLGLGIRFGLDARAVSLELSDKPPGEPWDDQDRRRLARGEDAERNMAIALGAGSAAVIAGGVLYAIGVASGEGERFALQPRATPDSILVHMSGTFWAF